MLIWFPGKADDGAFHFFSACPGLGTNKILGPSRRERSLTKVWSRPSRRLTNEHLLGHLAGSVSGNWTLDLRVVNSRPILGVQIT